jgi:hypothetical protein
MAVLIELRTEPCLAFAHRRNRRSLHEFSLHGEIRDSAQGRQERGSRAAFEPAANIAKEIRAL